MLLYFMTNRPVDGTLVNYRSKVGVLVSMDVGQYDAVRLGPRPVKWSWQSLVATAHQYLVPPARIVRGDFVAMDSLLEALTVYGTKHYYNFYTPRAAVQSLKQRVHDQWNVAASRATVLPRGAFLSDSNLTALLAPSIAFGEAFRLREIVMQNNPVPVIALSHGLSSPGMIYDTFLRTVLAPTYAYDSLVCTSRASAKALLSLLADMQDECEQMFHTPSIRFNGTVDIVPLGVDLKLFCSRERLAARKQLDLPLQGMLLISVGRISPMKSDIMPLIYSIEGVIRDNPRIPVFLIIAGTMEEPYTALLQKYVDTHGLNKQIRFLRDISDATKGLLYSAADIFVALADSLQESFGLTVVEAMAAGVPQVVSDWDGYRDTVVHEETGFLVPTVWTSCDEDLKYSSVLFGSYSDHVSLGQSVATNMGKFKQCIQVLIDNPTLRHSMARNSRERAESEFSYQAMSARIENLIEDKMKVAPHLQSEYISRPFCLPNYFSQFKEYASRLAVDTDHIALVANVTNDQILEAAELVRLSAASPTGVTAVIVSDIIKALRQEMPRGEPATQYARVIGDVITEVSRGSDVSNAHVKRCMMWLVKMGFAIIADSSEPVAG